MRREVAGSPKDKRRRVGRFKGRNLGNITVLAVAAVLALNAQPALAQDAKAKGFEERVEELRAAAAQGPVPVIVRFDLGLIRPFEPEGELSATAAAQQREQIREVRERILQRVGTTGISSIKRYDTLPIFAATVNQVALTRLASDPEVLDIERDEPLKPSLDSSIPVMDIDLAWGLGYTGSGQAVAILDTGVDNDHAFFGGRVVSEACYSTTNASLSSTSFCPGGVSESTAPESGENCDIAIDGCDHGTHVSGIAAGNGASFDGAARDADIIAIQVFSRIDDAASCSPFPSPCITAWTSDIIKGLERVYNLRNTYDIAAANMSLGGGLTSSHCDTQSIKTIIDSLASADIATAIAAGNDGVDGFISFPACVSTAIAVGSTTDADAVSSFSNHSGLVDVMAVGSSVNSSVPGGGFANFNGTSMATPHVAGVWALFKHAGGTAVSGIETCLENTGVGVTRGNFTVPRIDVDDAITAFLGGTCGAPPAGPANDDFVDAVVLSGNVGTVTGTNVNATGEPGEPNHVQGQADPLASVWWSWTPSVSAHAVIDTLGSDYDTDLAVYTGTAVGALTEVTANEDLSFGTDVLQSVVRFHAIAGTTYRIVVDGYSSLTGDITLNYDTMPLQVAVGLNPAGQGWTEIMNAVGGNANWVRVDWGAYNSANGETRPAWCDVDGDGRLELVIGLGPFPGNGGWLEVKDDEATGFVHLAWLQVPWGAYNSANGETWVACGNVENSQLWDAPDEIVVGLGGPDGQGWFYVFDDALTGYAGHSGTPGGDGWLRLGWGSYNSSVGETRPAVGNLDSDAEEEIVLGLAPGGAGWVQVLDDASTGFAPLTGTPVADGWLQLGWPSYNSVFGETWPAVCDLNSDGDGEVVLGVGTGGAGWGQILDSASGFGAPTPDTPATDGWFQVDWGSYNTAVGAVHPACGLNVDVPEELLLGLGSYPDDVTGEETGGWLELKDDLLNSVAHLDWWRVHWADYNNADGLTRPAIAR